MGRLYRIKRQLEKKWENYQRKKIKPNKNALWIFGVQKSGTSAIAALLARRTGKSVTIDTPLLWDPYYSEIRKGQLCFTNHISNNPFDFSKDIIKEPAASVLIDKVDSYFNLKQFIFIYRNPYDVIRSILNRLDLPGDMENIDLNLIDENWQVHFDKEVNYIDSLINLWIEVYSQNSYIESDRCIFVKYEDFKLDKQNFIDSLVDTLGFNKINDIKDILDHSFQPKGNSEVNLIHFFGINNYKLIERRTKPFLR